MKIKASILAFLLIFFLAGCAGTTSNRGSTGVRSTGQSQSGGQRQVGISGQGPTILRVVRPSLTGNYQQTIASFDSTVKDIAAVQRLYAADLALPDASKYGYPLPCPDDLGLVYHLTFLKGASQLQQVDVQALGCQWVYLNQTDVRRANQSFLTLLASTVGLTSLVPTGLLPTPV